LRDDTSSSNDLMAVELGVLEAGEPNRYNLIGRP
jgi:hypothetical protein